MGSIEPHTAPRKCLLAYFIYGSRHTYQVEAAFSIATARQALARDESRSLADHGVEIVVITDQTALDPPLDARILSVSAAELAEWTQDGLYNHRAKLCALQRLLREDADAVALVDTDTYWKGSPAALFGRVSDTQSVMHACEGKVAEDSEWHAVFADPVREAALNAAHCTRQTEMFNSGVIALTRANSALADEALRWLDTEMAISSAFNLEQVAVSVALQQKTVVVGCEDLLAHYWGHERPFIHIQIAQKLAAKSADIEQLGFPRADVTNRLLSRALAALLRWDADSRFAYQAMLSARTSHQRGDGFEHAWNEVAVDALERSRDVHGRPPSHVRGLRRAIGMLERIAPWLDDTSRQRWQRVWQLTE